MVQEWQIVHSLDDDVFICIDLFWHSKFDSQISKRKQGADGHLLGKVLVLLHNHQCQQYEDCVVLQFTESIEVAHSFCGCLLKILLVDKELSLVVNLARLRILEHEEDVVEGRCLKPVDTAALFLVHAFRFKVHTSRVLTLYLLDFCISSGPSQSNLGVDVVTSLLHELTEVTRDEAC